MKKTLTIILSIIIVLTLGTVLTIKVINDKNKDRIANEVLHDVVDKLKFMNKGTMEYNANGVMDINASYKGAHGESYPASYNYNFELNNNEITLENDMYYSLNLDSKLLNIYNIFSKLDNETINKISLYNNLEKLDKEMDLVIDNKVLNELFGTNFSNTMIIIFTKGLIDELDYYVIELDNISISVYDNNIVVSNNDDVVKLILNDSGYSANINDTLKMNVYYNDDNVEYNIAVNDNVLYFKLMNNEIIGKLSGEAAIYFGLDLDLKFDDNVLLNKVSEDSNTDNCPLLRYVNHIDYSFWR